MKNHSELESIWLNLHVQSLYQNRNSESDNCNVFTVKGVGKASRQFTFMDQLIDMVYIADSAEDPRNKLFREPGVVR